MASLFGIDAEYMQRKLVPGGGGTWSFGLGEGKDLSASDLLEIVEECEAEAVGYLRLKYQGLMRHVDGERVIVDAAGGETSLQLGLFPVVAGTVTLFRNFPMTRAWRERRPADAMEEEFSVEASTGAVTLSEALSEGDRVYAVYDHEAASKFLGIKRSVGSLAAAEIARRFAYFRSAEGFDRFEAWEVSARAHLRDLGKPSGPTEELIERLDLVDETRPRQTFAGIMGD